MGDWKGMINHVCFCFLYFRWCTQPDIILAYLISAKNHITYCNSSNWYLSQLRHNFFLQNSNEPIDSNEPCHKPFFLLFFLWSQRVLCPWHLEFYEVLSTYSTNMQQKRYFRFNFWTLARKSITEPRHEETCLLGLDQIRLKLASSAT